MSGKSFFVRPVLISAAADVIAWSVWLRRRKALGDLFLGPYGPNWLS